MVSSKVTGPEVFGREVQNLSDFFYADDGLLPSPMPNRLRAALHVLTGLFDRGGIQTNVVKMVRMKLQTFSTSGSLSEVAYTQRMNGIGLSYR